jgi:hypothetical protein
MRVLSNAKHEAVARALIADPEGVGLPTNRSTRIALAMVPRTAIPDFRRTQTLPPGSTSLRPLLPKALSRVRVRSSKN